MKLKAQVVVEDSEEEIYLKDFYLESNKIDCWYIAEENELGRMINIFIAGECFSILQEQHIVDLLMREFVEPYNKSAND